MRFTLLIVLTLSFAGCKDASLPAPAEAAFDRAKTTLTGDRLPEKSSEAAITNHGHAKLLEWAEKGDGKAQHFVAIAYLNGNTVPKNFDAAGKWALRAANQGLARSQFLIGLIRIDAATGGHLLAVEPNFVRAYMWLSLAAAQGHEPARNELDRIQAAMDPRWVQRSQTLAAAWQQCKAKECQDFEPDPGISSRCKDRPSSLLCP